MDQNVKVAANTVSAYGLHEVELISLGAAPRMEDLQAQYVPDHARESMFRLRWVEDPKGLGLQHVHFWWQERGVVDFSRVKEVLGTLCVPAQDSPASGLRREHGLPLRYAVLWWIGPGERLSFAADVAAFLHKRELGTMPSVAWVRKMPAGAPDAFEVGEGDDHVMLELRQADWVPERFVVVGAPREEN